MRHIYWMICITGVLAAVYAKAEERKHPPLPPELKAAFENECADAMPKCKGKRGPEHFECLKTNGSAACKTKLEEIHENFPPPPRGPRPEGREQESES